jgi:hypothetical protein
MDGPGGFFGPIAGFRAARHRDETFHYRDETNLRFRSKDSETAAL